MSAIVAIENSFCIRSRPAAAKDSLRSGSVIINQRHGDRKGIATSSGSNEQAGFFMHDGLDHTAGGKADDRNSGRRRLERGHAKALRPAQGARTDRSRK